MDTSTLFRVDGLVAVVTGGGTGIGLMMTKALIAGGASKVYILGRRRERLEEAATDEKIVPIVCDVSSKPSLQEAVDVVTKESGYVNLVACNAGALGPTNRLDHDLSIPELRKTLFEDVSTEDFTATLHVNVTGAYFTMLAFLELLDEGNQKALHGGYGAPSEDGIVPLVQSQVIFTSSVGGFSRDRLSPPAYSASKMAIMHLAKHASTNLAKFGIRVNAIAPGLFPSEMATWMTQARDPATEDISHRLFIPGRRFGGIEEMGGTVLYLASRAGAYCNGLMLLLDGGRMSVMLSEY